MQGRDTIDGVATDDRQVRHAHAAFALLVNQRQARQKVVVTGAMLRRQIQKLFVNAENNFKMARQHVVHQTHWPGFQRLRHEGVVGVREGFATN